MVSVAQQRKVTVGHKILVSVPERTCERHPPQMCCARRSHWVSCFWHRLPLHLNSQVSKATMGTHTSRFSSTTARSDLAPGLTIRSSSCDIRDLEREKTTCIGRQRPSGDGESLTSDGALNWLPAHLMEHFILHGAALLNALGHNDCSRRSLITYASRSMHRGTHTLKVVPRRCSIAPAAISVG